MSPLRTLHLTCPGCDVVLSADLRDGIELQLCGDCRGIWLGHLEFTRLMESAQPGGDHELLVHNDGSDRRRCPVCAQPMEIGWLLFLQMDQCEQHGIWFDRGELDRALRGDIGREVLESVDARARQRNQGQPNLKLADWLMRWLG